MRFATLIFIVLFVAGCGSGQSPFELVNEELLSFHEYYDSGDCEAIYSTSSAAFRGTVEASTFENSLQILRADMGRYLSSENIAGSSSLSAASSNVSVIIYSQFERGQVVEKFSFVFENGKYLLKQYQHGAYDEPPERGDHLFSLQ